MLLGDVLAVVALIGVGALAQWAMYLTFGFLFRRKSVTAQAIVERGPGTAVYVGLVTVLLMTVIGLAIYALPNPITKVVGLTILMTMLGLAGLGGSGIARLISERIRNEDPDVKALPAMVRGSLYLTLACLLPLLGWFLIVPGLLVVGAGAGVQAIFMRTPEPIAPPIHD